LNRKEERGSREGEYEEEGNKEGEQEGGEGE
jgi:hypothetical protein